MKKWYLITFAILMSGCGLLKDVSKNRSNETAKIVESTSQWKRMPGEVIILPAPLTPNERQKDTTITTLGKKGATVTTSYDKEGFVSGQIINCPDSEETKQTNSTLEYSLREKQVEKTANIELANTIGKWLAITLIPGQFFFAVAYWLRGKKPKLV